MVDVCGLFQIVLGIPPVSNPPSAMIFKGIQVGDGEGLPVEVAVGVAVAVDVAVGDGEPQLFSEK